MGLSVARRFSRLLQDRPFLELHHMRKSRRYLAIGALSVGLASLVAYAAQPSLQRAISSPSATATATDQPQSLSPVMPSTARPPGRDSDSTSASASAVTGSGSLIQSHVSFRGPVCKNRGQSRLSHPSAWAASLRGRPILRGPTVRPACASMALRNRSGP